MGVNEKMAASVAAQSAATASPIAVETGTFFCKDWRDA
jgi:hypothetical protein